MKQRKIGLNSPLKPKEMISGQVGNLTLTEITLTDMDRHSSTGAGFQLGLNHSN